MTSHISREQISLPLSPQQEESLEALVRTLTPDQALWVSGYLAGIARQGSVELPADLAGQQASAAPQLTILYATESGNAAALAEDIKAAAATAGLQATAQDLADYSIRSLKKERFILFVTSTHGEGDPPDPAATFFEDLNSKKAPKLPELRFAVLALGDSTYDYYCEAGKFLDRRMAELGGERLLERIDCDVDYKAEADAWTAQFLDKMAPLAPPASAPAAVSAPGPAQAQPQAQFNKNTPFPAPIIENIRITGRGSGKVIHHVEVSTEDSGLTYEPGDALGIVPQNEPKLVEDILETLQISGEADVETESEPLARALEHRYEITTLTPKFLQFWAEKSGAPELKALLGDEARDARRAFLENNQLLDLVQQYPVTGLAAPELLEPLRKLQPRLYSLASSPEAVPDEAHITVSLVEFMLNGRPCHGVASGHMCMRLDEDATLPVYIQKNRNFRLPADGDRPIIMLGAGTGVAPYRGFLQERQERGIRGKSWLLFGERQFRTDFLYQTEWQKFLKDGYLSRMDVAFSRDQDEKIYVQDRMRDQSADLYAWLQEGAHLYLCGDAERLAPDVHTALVDIVAAEGAMTRDAAEDYVRDLQRQKRFQRDVY